MDAPTTASDDAARPRLRRALGPYLATAVVVGNVIGSGIFLKPGNIAAESGQVGLILAVWVLGGVLCILGALCMAELATMLPRAGGLYVYLRHAYGDLCAFLFGWCEFLFARPASIGALAVAFVGSFALALDWKASTPIRVLLASVLIVGMAWVNILGVIWGGRLQLATTAIKVVFLILVALAPICCLPFGWSPDASHFTLSEPGRQATMAGQVAAVLLAVMWAYDGWHGITPLAEEVRHPQRNIPLALFAGIGILILLYVSANIAYHSVLTLAQMRQAGDHAAEEMLYQLWGAPGRTAMSIVVMCSTFGAINSNILWAPRIPFAMGRDGLFPSRLGDVHAVYCTPVPAILVTAGMSMFLIALVAVAKLGVANVDAAHLNWRLSQQVTSSLQDGSIFDLLTNFVIFSLSVFYLLSVAAVMVLRVRHPEWTRPYRTWGYPIVPLIFLAVYSWFLVQIYVGAPLESRTGTALIAVGVPVYFGYRAWKRRVPPWVKKEMNNEEGTTNN